MKKPIFPLLILAACVIFVSCRKEGTNVPYSSLIGSNWTVVNNLQVAGSLMGNGPPTTSNYIGKAGDYFNFNSNGKLYFSMDDQKDTGTTYKISGSAVLCINYYYEGTATVLDSGFYAAYIISNLTTHTCTLTQNIPGPDIDIKNTINLSR
jgi:hypothetical protein